VRLRQIFALAGLGLGLAARPASAQTAPVDARLEQAKEQFRQGVALLNAGDTSGALDDFLRSRELRASGRNTVNAAICLERLGRYDEALELYEDVVANFTADLEQEDRENLAPVMASLGAKLGYLELTANVDGEVTVSGRARGRLPLQSALRVLPGKQTIVIVKPGYLPFTSSVQLAAGRTERVEARLEALGSSRASVSSPAGAAFGAAPSVERAQPGAARSNLKRTLAWTLGAAGVAQLGVAGYFGVRAIQLHGDSKDADAGRAADASTIIGATGLVTTAVAVYLLLSSSSAPPAASASSALHVGLLGLGGLEMTGSF
jgi:tetratricopeptide (TPR) repeat protein